jgi:UDP-N-acetylglucosamine 2-epimerase
MVRVLSVFGTRPEAIKMAPVIEELASREGRVESRICVTGQHREMLDQVLDLFAIAPDVDLRVMTDNQPPWRVASAVLEGMDEVIASESPDLVLVHGDTTTTMAASLSAFYRRIPVGHVEAGLRTHSFYTPFPEEMNRRVADSLSVYHFAPTAQARRNLLDEGVSADSIYVTGNTVIDALLEVAGDPKAPPHGVPVGGRFVLVTAHRRENFGEPLENICRALRTVADDLSDIEVVYPVHLNPRVQETARAVLSGHARIHLVDPMPYAPFVDLMKKAAIVVTDSGGLQEEAPALGKPVLVLRNETERPEAVEAGTVRIVGTDERSVAEGISALLTDDGLYSEMANAVNPYGDGRAAVRIVDGIEHAFGVGKTSRPADFVPKVRNVNRCS